jgi:hypothetical protein
MHTVVINYIIFRIYQITVISRDNYDVKILIIYSENEIKYAYDGDPRINETYVLQMYKASIHCICF